jgi:hypothetical protein
MLKAKSNAFACLIVPSAKEFEDFYFKKNLAAD